MTMLKCVIFDLDNTLITCTLDFDRIKAEIGTDQTILEYRATVNADEQRCIDDILDRHERVAAAESEMMDGAHELLVFLAEHEIHTALLTRNSRRSVDTIMERHGLRFEVIVSRDDAPPKPSPEPIWLICRQLGVAPEETLMVGDYLFDIQSGEAAGSMTMLLDGPNRHKFDTDPDFEVSSLHEAIEIVRERLKKKDA